MSEKLKPLTDVTRQALREWAENVTSPSSWCPQSEIDQATAYLCYETTLQKQDERIVALVTVLKKVEWGAHPNYFGLQYCPSCHMARIAGHTDECKLADALAVTDG